MQYFSTLSFHLGFFPPHFFFFFTEAGQANIVICRSTWLTTTRSPRVNFSVVGWGGGGGEGGGD